MVPIRILCLDDDGDTCELVSSMLQSEGYEVITTGTIDEARRLIKANDFSLYIVDEKLPDGDGIDFIRQVKESGARVPILVHSAAAFKQDIDAAIQAGANDYLVKPNGWPKLCQTVTRLLRQGRSAR